LAREAALALASICWSADRQSDNRPTPVKRATVTPPRAGRAICSNGSPVGWRQAQFGFGYLFEKDLKIQHLLP